jgi:hypothetical protein
VQRDSRIPLLHGRILTRAEVLRGAHLTIVSQTFVQRYLAGVNPIGHQVVPVVKGEFHKLLRGIFDFASSGT